MDQAAKDKTEADYKAALLAADSKHSARQKEISSATESARETAFGAYLEDLNLAKMQRDKAYGIGMFSRPGYFGDKPFAKL